MPRRWVWRSRAAVLPILSQEERVDEIDSGVMLIEYGIRVRGADVDLGTSEEQVWHAVETEGPSLEVDTKVFGSYTPRLAMHARKMEKRR
jgi:hypothetical protein